MEIPEILKNLNAQKQIEYLVKKYSGKRIVIYGAGKFFDVLKKEYDLSGLNVIAVSDKKFSEIKEPVFDESVGYNVIAPMRIYTLKPDMVLLCVQEDYFVEKDICENIFKQTGYKFKYTPFFKRTLGERIFQDWEDF